MSSHLARLACIGACALVMLASASGCADVRQPSAIPSNSESDAIPESIRDAALEYVTSQYAVEGTQVVIQAAESRSAAEWIDLEPSAKAHVAGGAVSETATVYGLTFTGEFRVVGPMYIGPTGTPSVPVVNYVAGRIILDASGQMISIALEGPEAIGAKPFGDPIFKD